MTTSIDNIAEMVTTELSALWAAHNAVGLDGFMRLYTPTEQVPFRNKEPGVEFWFGPGDTAAAAAEVLRYWRKGELPNSSLLLDPIVHRKTEDGSYRPIGSGVIWCTSLALGIDVLKAESGTRLRELGVLASPFHRGENDRAGLKVLGICSDAQMPEGKAVQGCREIYGIACLSSEQYAPCYLFSGISYLTNNGLFRHPDFAAMFPKDTLRDQASRRKIVENATIQVQRVLDAAYCWDAYEHHHALYEKFGTNPDNVQANMQFFNMLARDVDLFDATGPLRKEADAMIEFIVPGMVPRGSVTILAGAGGTGKSSLAHQLCVMASTDYDPGEEAPRWLGQRLAIEKCKGICVYFAGEDGPPIINARAAIFDPHGRAKRLMFQRIDFGAGVTFLEHLKRLKKIPAVPIMIIDPARKYLSGDEEDSGAVSGFFDAIEDFAISKGTAVIIVHHLQKSADPKSPREITDLLRGSQVFVDRPRVIIGVVRDGAYAVIGLAKNNIPPNLGMVTEERVFARDPKKLQLVWMPGHKGVRGASLSPEELEKLAQEAKKEGR
ncbi:MAG: AAA family ATPase [Pseudomonadota bacterium]|nr:AAA family ATPase [Pseudomonadota bacterium]MDE3037171.1 AAA family ATPase [Pseudomonadota bacterium]